MSRYDVPPGEMTPAALDDETMDRLLDGRIHPDDAPAGYQRVAALIAVAAKRATAHDHEQLPVGLADLITSSPTPITSARRHRRIGRKVAIVSSGFLLAATGVAAATNHLPAPVQAVVSDVAAQLGVNIPDARTPDEADATEPVTPPAPTTCPSHPELTAASSDCAPEPVPGVTSDDQPEAPTSGAEPSPMPQPQPTAEPPAESTTVAPAGPPATEASSPESSTPVPEESSASSSSTTPAVDPSIGAEAERPPAPEPLLPAAAPVTPPPPRSS